MNNNDTMRIAIAKAAGLYIQVEGLLPIASVQVFGDDEHILTETRNGDNLVQINTKSDAKVIEVVVKTQNGQTFHERKEFNLPEKK